MQLLELAGPPEQQKFQTIWTDWSSERILHRFILLVAISEIASLCFKCLAKKDYWHPAFYARYSLRVLILDLGIPADLRLFTITVSKVRLITDADSMS